LAHRWEPKRLFVIFTAYFDEADTHGPAPTVILAAYLGHAFQWRRFEKKLAKIQAREGFSIFHARHFKARTGEFRGWSDAKCDRLIDKLKSLVGRMLTQGLAVALSRERYLTEYRVPPIPRKMNLDSQLGVCFRACMAHLFDVIRERGYQDRLHVVMEDGHPNIWDCGRIFKDLREPCKILAGRDLLGEFSVRPKEGCPPLMVADMLAATYSMFRQAVQKGEIDSRSFRAKPDTKGPLAFIELKPNGLKDLKIGFEKMRQLKIERWRTERAAKEASSA
jgi:hypothetical protein